MSRRPPAVAGGAARDRAVALLADVGNTTVTLGLGVGDRVLRVRRVPTAGCTVAALLEAIRTMRPGRPPSLAAFCSVAPRASAACRRALRRAAGVAPLEVSSRLRLGFTFRYPRPETLGADRLANAAGAVARFGAPVIVADFGTAVTVDAVDRGGRFIGGLIAPGARTMAGSLQARTALVPAVEPIGRLAPIGTSTAGAVRLGVRLSCAGLLREAICRFRALPGMAGAAVCVTGGDGAVVAAAGGPVCRFEPTLTLYGVWRIARMNGEEGRNG